MFFRFPFYEIFPWRASSFFLGTCIFPVDQSLWFVWMSVDNERYGSSRLCHITTAAASYETVNVDLSPWSHCPNIVRPMGVETHFRNDSFSLLRNLMRSMSLETSQHWRWCSVYTCTSWVNCQISVTPGRIHWRGVRVTDAPKRPIYIFFNFKFFFGKLMVYFLFRPKNKEVPIRKNICRRVKDKVSNTLLRDEHKQSFKDARFWCLAGLTNL